MSENRECGADAAAYALGALDAQESEAFREHMAQCTICQDEVGAFRQAADALALTAPQLEPPRRLRRRVMRAVRAEPGARQLPAPQSWRFARTLPRPALAAGLGLAAVVVIAGGVELASTGSGPARVIQASVVGSSASAQLRIGGGRAELLVSHMPPPAAGQIYEVWLKRGQRPPSPTPALFSVTSNGAADVDVPGDLHGVSEVLVTPEPAGGSPAPTHAPVIVARIA